ncbi:GIY-YIG nuclease family protein [Salmonella enterica]|nr:GIY-YIG nuclease family protein [Salmonella enterica]EHA2158781.1 GIY-YIG nuclease family protein [Salmonella enterica]
MDTPNILAVVIVIAVIAVFVGRYWERKVSKEKLDKAKYDLEVTASANELLRKSTFEENESNRNQEHYKKVRELESLIEDEKRKIKEGEKRSADIFNKAVKYAFDFEKSIREQHQTAQKEIQAVLDDTYKFKVRTILSQVTLKNFEKKFEALKREKTSYINLLADREFFKLDDNSDWDSVEKQLEDTVLQLQEAQNEREAQQEIKRQMREEQQRAEELERRQREAEAKERELEERRKAIEQALLAADEEHRKELEETRSKLEQEIDDVRKQYERAKSMAQLTKQGHVYIISNIGSFGEKIFKIGMTRRLEPMDRINELSSASVPFDFDVHAMISCEDAPALENALHNELNNSRLNKVNMRKEFFETDIEHIIACVEKHHGKIEYVAKPAAIQYYRTLEIREEQDNNTAESERMADSVTA